jgi:hypothetical protein
MIHVIAFVAFLLQQGVPARVAVLSPRPFTAPPAEQIAALERKVAIDPADSASRLELLNVYIETAALARDDFRQARLDHIRWFVDNDPANDRLGSPPFYVGSANVPYANRADHANIASLWNAQASAHFDDPRIVLNAVRFLSVEDRELAESLFQRAIAARPADTTFSSRLGFFYADGLVGADAHWTGHCRAELDRTADVHVLMGASIALPNVAMHRTGGGPGYEAWVRYSEELQRRASGIDRVAAGAGIMPVEFGMFAADSQGVTSGLLAQPPRPAQIRVAGNVQASLLISSPAPVAPNPDAHVHGVVRFDAVINPEGKIQSVQLVSGPPLLVQAAMQAVQTWVYKPTLLNGQPIAVATTIDVDFP